MTEKTMIEYVRVRLDYVKECLEIARQGRQLTVVANESGVPYWTLVKYVQGVHQDPSLPTAQKLYDYFRSIEKKRAGRQKRVAA